MKRPEFDSLLSSSSLKQACQTISGFPVPSVQLATRLQFIADLVSDAGPLPPAAILVWRDQDHSVRHALVGVELTVGRQVERGLSLPEDKLLSRVHFVVRAADGRCVLEDLRSRNGTAVNQSGLRIKSHELRDGDLILAGNYIFIFLNQGITR
ncbi:MAG: FHA domain-containing protein [Verrucomicrobiota bacterium]|jgi:hypothetical protein